MPTSGNTIYTLNRDEMCRAALRLCRAIDPEETPKSSEIETTAEALNLMLKFYQTKGLQLWLKQEATLFIDGSRSYTFPGAHATSDTYSDTSLSSAAISGARKFSVASSAGMSQGDYIGIELDNGTIQWSTITVLAGQSVSISDTLNGAAASGNSIFSYTNKLQRPLSLLSVRYYDGSNETPVEIVPRETFMDQPNKASAGRINEVYYSPQRDTGILYVWPVGVSDKTPRLFMTVQRPIENVDSKTDEFDVPQEWMEPIKWGLAWRIAPEFGSLSVAEISGLKRVADEMLEEACGWDSEKTSVTFNIDLSSR